MIRWRDSVGFKYLHSAMVLALLRIEQIYGKAGLNEVWITSGNDSKHMEGSKHYLGKAVDLHTKSLADGLKVQVLEQVKAALGPRFTVLLEDFGLPNEHLHVQLND